LLQRSLERENVPRAGSIGQGLERIVVRLQPQANLLEVIAALHAAGCFAGGLHRRQQQGDEHTDDGDHHQQLHERKSGSLSHACILSYGRKNKMIKLRTRKQARRRKHPNSNSLA
jgi:hypothetical protein